MPRHLISDGPIYSHDCQRCTYLGSSVFIMTGESTRSNGVDMYIHLNPSGRHTLIRRFSSTPSDYNSFKPSDYLPSKGVKPRDLPAPCKAIMELAKLKGYIS